MSNYTRLKFSDDQTFTIVQIGDLHYGFDTEEDRLTLAGMETVLSAEKPNLIVFTGDIVKGFYARDQQRQFLEVLAVPESLAIPYAIVLGNHDSEHKSCTRDGLMKAAASLPHCLAQVGPEHVSGVGNYVLPIEDSAGTIRALLYFFDTEASPLAGFKPDQIAWYVEQSNTFAKRAGDAQAVDECEASDVGGSLPALAFFHRPLPEYSLLWDLSPCYGQKQESIGSPALNSGMFAAMKECGDVKGVFVGHDHLNDFYGNYCGIYLGYGRAGGSNYAGNERYARGSRVIRLRLGKQEFETWLRMTDGSFSPQEEHLPVGQPAVSPAAQPDVAGMTAMSFNLRNPSHEHDIGHLWPDRKLVLTDIIERNRPTVIGTQEGLLNMLKDMEAEMQVYAWVGHGRSGDHRGEHNAIFYNKGIMDLLDWGQFWLTDYTEEFEKNASGAMQQRICTWVLLKFRHKPHKKILIYNTHLDHHSGLTRQKDVCLIWRRLKEHAKRLQVPYLLLGDFDSHPDEPVIQFLRGNLELEGMLPGVTDGYSISKDELCKTFHGFKGGREGRPVDYIFASKDLNYRKFSVIRQQFSDKFPSDHYPIKATIHV